MKTLEAHKLIFSSDYPDLDSVSAALDTVGKNNIEQINWKGFDYKPEVAFSIAYIPYEILLKYYVTEEYFKAEKTESNQNVFEDSCVEFFVSPADDGIYYNLEFNGIGTCLLGTGTSRENRDRADPQIIAGIRRKTSVGNKTVSERKGKFEWTITIAVPLGVFFHHKIKTLMGKTIMANFYKCGDMLTIPHYITWSPVKTPKPDFHRPEFFGMVRFD
jgi:hypothetical protein